MEENCADSAECTDLEVWIVIEFWNKLLKVVLKV